MERKIKLTPRVQKFLDDVTYKINPKFEIKNKARPSGLYRLASAVVGIFNRKMDTDYITVINGQCWFPGSYFDENGDLSSSVDEMQVIQILAHETVHEYDRMRLGTLPFTFLYLFPQVLAVLGFFSLLAFWDAAWLWCLLFFVFLAPMPAPGRSWLEVRGYKMDMTLLSEDGWDPAPSAEEIFEDSFAGASYYFMMPFKDWVIDQLMDFSHEREEPYRAILKWHRSHRTAR